MENITVLTLPNNLKIMHIPYPAIGSVYVSALGKAGAHGESLENVGVAHMLEHCVFDGTEKYPTERLLNDQIENVGGYLNARTSFSYVEYYTRLLKEDVEVGFDVLSQIVLHPNLNQKTLIRERKIVREEILKHKETELAKFSDATDIRYYPKQRFGLDVGGRLKDIAKINIQDIRDFHEKYYVAENFIIGVIGDVSIKSVRDLAEKYFGKMRQGAEFEIPTLRRISGPDFYTRKSPKAEQVTLKIRFDAPTYTDPASFPAKFLAIILGSGFSSRLFRKLRTELGYVYSVNASFHKGTQIGTFSISMKLSEKNVDSAIQVVKEEISKLRTELVEDLEFEHTLKALLTSQVFYFENPGNVIDFYTDLLRRDFYPEYDYPNILEEYKKVTKQEIQEVANQIFSKEPFVTMFSKNLSTNFVKKSWYK